MSRPLSPRACLGGRVSTPTTFSTPGLECVGSGEPGRTPRAEWYLGPRLGRRAPGLAYGHDQIRQLRAFTFRTDPRRAGPSRNVGSPIHSGETAPRSAHRGRRRTRRGRAPPMPAVSDMTLPIRKLALDERECASRKPAVRCSDRRARGRGPAALRGKQPVPPGLRARDFEQLDPRTRPCFPSIPPRSPS
jgi:hypothetical protein